MKDLYQMLGLLGFAASCGYDLVKGRADVGPYQFPRDTRPLQYWLIVAVEAAFAGGLAVLLAGRHFSN